MFSGYILIHFIAHRAPPCRQADNLPGHKITGQQIGIEPQQLLNRSRIERGNLLQRIPFLHAIDRAAIFTQAAIAARRHAKHIARAQRCQADILVAAVGRAGFVTADMVKPGAVVIDVGINRVDGQIVGDVDYEAVSEKAGYITPVPGGVGQMTIAMLLANTLDAVKPCGR